MKLVNRVSLFFLVALAIVMGAFGVVLNVVARRYLHQQFDDQLHAALAMLVASADVEEDGVEWNTEERLVDIDAEFDNDSLRWAVFNDQRQVVDFSRNQSSLAAQSLSSDNILASDATDAASVSPAKTGSWRRFQRDLAATDPDEDDVRDPNEYPAITIVVAGSTAAIESALAQLALATIVLSALAWLVAAALGRWYCGAALAPVRKMAASARSIAPDDSQRRLPVSSTNDELAELGRAFNGLLDQLFQAYERQRRFAGDAAHQLRTPLTVFQGQLDVALRRRRGVDEYEEVLGTLKEQVVEFKQLVEAMLMLARSNSELAPANVQVVDIASWLHEHAAHWQSHPRRADLLVQAETAAPARVSLPLVAQLVDNLVDNAFKYSPAGSPVQVAVARDAAHEQVSISVSDRGQGIPSELQDAIFEPFFRSPQARQKGVAGAGLGLAIAQRVAEVLGGTLQCDSSPGQGSTFTLTLPLAALASPDEAISTGKSAAGAPLRA
jgi:heavy metal sensor kinase